MPSPIPAEPHARNTPRRNAGASLIVILMILVVVSILGISGAQISMMAEHGARNDRDTQVAWQAAEAGLVDAEYDIRSGSRSAAIFTVDNNSNKIDVNNFVSGCGDTGDQLGLCSLPTDPASKPPWLAVPLTGGKAVEFGRFTSRTFPAGTGAESARKPRYIIEAIPDAGYRDTSASARPYVYRVTALGYGPRDDIQAVVQMIFRN